MREIGTGTSFALAGAMQPSSRPYTRAAASGIGATLLDATALVIGIELLALPVATAAFAAALLGACFSFAANKYWAFDDRSRLELRQLLSFGLVAFGSAGAMGWAVELLTYDVGLPYLAAKALAAALIFCCWTYPAQSRVVFAR